MNNIRLRFAPSPTGFLHIGNLRTVLLNYFIAKSLGGQFILRIEDTDAKRKVDDAEDKLVSILDWIGIKFDEGYGVGGDYGPYVQTERLDVYKKHINRLIEEDKAYYCFCTPLRLTKMREDLQAKKLPPRYDRHCRDLTKEEVAEKMEAGESYVIRQKMPLDGEIIVKDELRGEIRFNAKEMDDHVLIKANGIPTYQFASVVDDHEMKISHVVRGDEWLPSFPKNILLYQLFGWEAPLFIHLPLVMNKEGGKLSKRQGSVFVEDFREAGYLKEALINFNVLLGWHPRGEEEVLSMDEIIAQFDYKNIGISSGIFDIDKLDYFNGVYIRKTELNELVAMCKPYLKENLELASDTKKTDEFIGNVIALEQERLKKLSEIGDLTRFFFVDDLEYEAELLVWKKSTKEETKVNLEKLLEFLAKIDENDWNSKALEEAVIAFLKENEYKIGDYLWPMRVSLSGERNSPGPFDIASVLGREEVLAKINIAINKLK